MPLVPPHAPDSPSRQSRRPSTAWLAGLAAGAVALLAACANAPQPDAIATLSPADLHWLDTVTFGADSASMQRLRRLGRDGFLAEQLKMPPTDPPEVAATIAALPVSQLDAVQRLREVREERQRINTLPDADAQQKARMALNQQRRELVLATGERHLLRAVYSPAQLREQMTWFWMNHFNLYAYKAGVPLLLPDFEEHVVRPRALGHFRDLLMATVTSGAMLDYLDNAQSSVGRINENYARELMELHTMGVSGGPSGSRYTQQDVQELARLLTGVGLNLRGEPPRLGPRVAALYRSDGVFEFNPNRHDFGEKVLLGHPIAPTGFGEVEQAVTILSRDPATARYISRKLAAWFVADDPPPALVSRMAATFTRTDGDIAAVLTTLFTAPELDALLSAPHRKFKDPMVYVVSSLRLAYDGRGVTQWRPALGWLAQLGEPLYGHVTPDGYAPGEDAWASSGQMIKRFEIARAIGTGRPPLAGAPPGTPPVVDNALFRQAIAPTLGATTRDALAQAKTTGEWNMVLLSSPEWMQR